jgi:agmatinase
MNEKVNFGGLPEEYSALEKAGIVIIPVAYDGTSTWMKGANKGPRAIIEASANMELYDIETDSEVYKKGIFTDKGVEGHHLPEDMVEAVGRRVLEYLEDDKFVVTVGGEHSVSIGAVKAHLEHCGQMSVLQLDAHSDMRDEYNGSKYNHACVMARIREFSPIVQVGIRSMDSSEKEFLEKGSVFWAGDICNNDGWIKKVVSKLSEKVYVTIDLDVFDPSIMPSTGTPEPGGLMWYEVLELLKAIIRRRIFSLQSLSTNC